MDLTEFHLDLDTALKDIDVVQVEVGVLKFDLIALLESL